MYFQIFVVFLMCIFSVTCAKEDLNEYILTRIDVGKCRANCISKFYQSTGEFQDGNNLECTPTTNWKCGMCWDYCDILIEEEQTRNQMCSDNICLDGCKLACNFYENNQNSKELSTRSSKIFDIKLSNSLLSWNYKTGENSNLKTVFVGFGLKLDGNWEELDQVLEEKISLENENQKLLSVSIFAITSEGILSFAVKNLTEDINFGVFHKLANQKEASPLYEKQLTAWLISSCVFLIFIIIIFIGLYFLFLHNKLFRTFKNKQSIPSSISKSLSDNSAFCIDLDQTIPHATTL